MRDIVLVHSSDLHLRPNGAGDDLHPLRCVLAAAQGLNADALLLAGDVFDANRLPSQLIEAAAALFATSSAPVVILPGNHDCLTAGSVYYHPALAVVAGLHILGQSGESVVFPHLDLEVWGLPHADYRDMRPLTQRRPRRTRWQVAMAHGHWVTRPEDSLRSWLITDEEIASSGADYVALGHWEVPGPAGSGPVPAYYSGSPQRAGTVNAVRLSPVRGVEVGLAPLPA